MSTILLLKNRLLLCMMLGTGIAACGGGAKPASTGQNDNAPQKTAAINSENAVAIARTAVQVTGMLHALGDIGGNVASAAYSEVSAGTSSIKTFNMINSASTQGRAVDLNRSSKILKNNARKAVIDLTETPCSGSGLATMQWNDVDDNSAFTADDTFNVNFNKCVDTMITLDGAFSISHLSVTGDPQSTGQPWELVATLNFEDLTVVEGEESSKVNGTVQLTFGVGDDGITESGVVSLDTLNHDMNGSIMEIKDYTVNFINDLNTNDLGMSGRGEIISEIGPISVNTIKPLQMNMEDHPSSGRLRLAVDHSVLTMNVMSSDSINLDIDEDGDGTIDSSIQPNWNQIHEMTNNMADMPTAGQRR